MWKCQFKWNWTDETAMHMMFNTEALHLTETDYNYYQNEVTIGPIKSQTQKLHLHCPNAIQQAGWITTKTTTAAKEWDSPMGKKLEEGVTRSTIYQKQCKTEGTEHVTGSA